MTRLNATQDAVLHHLLYEWQMFCFTYDLLKALPENIEPIRNSILESLIVHGRTLIEFFYKGTNSKDFEISQLDPSLQPLGLVAGSYLEDWWLNASKRVVHLSKLRQNALAGWHAENIRIDIQTQMDELEKRFGPFGDNWPGSRDQIGVLSACLGPKAFTPSRSGNFGPTGPTGSV